MGLKYSFFWERLECFGGITGLQQRPLKNDVNQNEHFG